MYCRQLGRKWTRRDFSRRKTPPEKLPAPLNVVSRAIVLPISPADSSVPKSALSHLLKSPRGERWQFRDTKFITTTRFLRRSVHAGPYLDRGLHEDRGGIINALSAEVQDRRVTLFCRACQGLVDFSLAADQRRMHEAPVKDAGALSGRAQQPEHQDDLNLIVKRKPMQQTSRRVSVVRGKARVRCFYCVRCFYVKRLPPL